MNKILKITIIIAMTTALTGSCIFIFLNIYKNPYKVKSIVFADNKPDTIINSLKQTLNGSSLPIKFLDEDQITSRQWFPSSEWWISDDDWNIIDKNAVSIISSDAFTIIHDSSDPLDSSVKKINRSLSKIFLDNGFALNIKNSSKSETDQKFYDYIIAFQKEETRCILMINKDNGQYVITCSDRFQEAYNEQIPYLKGLNIDNGVVYGIERIGNFATISVGLRRTGHFKIIKIDGEKMEEIFRGQEPPPCNLMTESGVPKEIYNNCFIDSYNLKY